MIDSANTYYHQDMSHPTENDSRQWYVLLPKRDSQNTRSARCRTGHDKCHGVIVHMICEIHKTRGLLNAEPDMTNVTV